VLKFIANTAEALGSGPRPSGAFLSFYAVTVCEAVAAAPRVRARRAPAAGRWGARGVAARVSPPRRLAVRASPTRAPRSAPSLRPSLGRGLLPTPPSP
jgi:hypothetical protein